MTTSILQHCVNFFRRLSCHFFKYSSGMVQSSSLDAICLLFTFSPRWTHTASMLFRSDLWRDQSMTGSIVCFSIWVYFYCFSSVFGDHCDADKWCYCYSYTYQSVLHGGSKADCAFLLLLHNTVFILSFLVLKVWDVFAKLDSLLLLCVA